MPNIERTSTGNAMLYRAPILPVSVSAPEQSRKPQKTIGIVSRAVNPKDITALTVDESGFLCGQHRAEMLGINRTFKRSSDTLSSVRRTYRSQLHSCQS